MIKMQSKHSRCTSRPGLRNRSPLNRGTAEIELMLSIIVFITIMSLVVAATKIAVARLDTARTAQFEAFQDATAAQSPKHSDNSALAPIDGTEAVRPTLPNRTHVAEPTSDITVSTSKSDAPRTVTVGGKAGFASPAWIYTAYPVSGQDQTDTEQWFTDYVSESHGMLTDPLRLAAPWTP